MNLSLKRLLKYKLLAVDGETGKIEDFYFDERFNTIRYLVVNTGNFLLKNLVLISPAFVNRIIDDEKLVKVSISKEKIENSPDVDTEKPISRLYEKSLFDYYEGGNYWTGYLAWGMNPLPVPIQRNIQRAVKDDTSEIENSEHYLRSVDEISGYRCELKDGTYGHIKDFMINRANWQIETFILNTKTIGSGEDLELDIRWIDRISYHDQKVHLDLAVRELEKAEV